MCTIADIPAELYPFVFDPYSKFKLVSLDYENPICGIHRSCINFNIEHINSHVNLTIETTAAKYENNIKYLQKRIDDFIDKINKNIECELNLIYIFKSEGDNDWGFPPSDVEIPTNYTDEDIPPIKIVQEYDLSGEFILGKSYSTPSPSTITHKNKIFRFEGVVLKNGYNFMMDLLSCIKKAIKVPES